MHTTRIIYAETKGKLKKERREKLAMKLVYILAGKKWFKAHEHLTVNGR